MELTDAKFIHYFILLMAWLDDTADQEGVKLGKARLAEVAWEDPRAKCLCGRRQISPPEMLKMLEQLNVSDEIKRLLKTNWSNLRIKAKRFVQKWSRKLNRSVVINN